MDNLKIANVLLKIAKSLEADYEYRSDPDHKHKPKGGGWKQTKQGWSKSDNSKQKTNSNTSNADSTPTESVKPEDYGNVNAPIRKFIKEAGNDPAFEISESNQKIGEELTKNYNVTVNKICHQCTVFNVLAQKRKEATLKALELKRLHYYADPNNYDKWLEESGPKTLDWNKIVRLTPQVSAAVEEKHRIAKEKCFVPNLKMFSISKERQGKLQVKPFKYKDPQVVDSVNTGITLIESIMDKSIIPNEQLTFKARKTKQGQGRSYYLQNTILLEDRDRYDVSAIAHEMGHFIEHHSPGIHAACNDFLNARTENNLQESLKRATNGGNYRSSEKCRKDHFFHPYCGKIYSDRSTEILSMGLEQLAKDPIGFYKTDREYYNFVRGVLSGKFNDYKKENDK